MGDSSSSPAIVHPPHFSSAPGYIYMYIFLTLFQVLADEGCCCARALLDQPRIKLCCPVPLAQLNDVSLSLPSASTIVCQLHGPE